MHYTAKNICDTFPVSLFVGRLREQKKKIQNPHTHREIKMLIQEIIVTHIPFVTIRNSNFLKFMHTFPTKKRNRRRRRRNFERELVI